MRSVKMFLIAAGSLVAASAFTATASAANVATPAAAPVTQQAAPSATVNVHYRRYRHWHRRHHVRRYWHPHRRHCRTYIRHGRWHRVCWR